MSMFQHIGLVGQGEGVVPGLCMLEGRLQETPHGGFGVDGVVDSPMSLGGPLQAVGAFSVLTEHFDVDVADMAGQEWEARPEVDSQFQTLSQPQEDLLRVTAIRNTGIAHRSEQDGVEAIAQIREGSLGQGLARGEKVIGPIGQADHFKPAAAGPRPIQTGNGLSHDLWADPVARDEGDANRCNQASTPTEEPMVPHSTLLPEDGMQRKWGVGMGIFAMLGLASAAEVAEGAKAPAFEARDQHGTLVRLADFQGKSAVVLYFYPKDDTPGCTAQACSLRDGFAAIQATGTVILGVSADTSQSHKVFAEKFHLPFSLLADPDKQIITAYGVKMPLLGFAKRVTFIIDRQGLVRKVITDTRTKDHDQQVLSLLKGIS